MADMRRRDFSRQASITFGNNSNISSGEPTARQEANIFIWIGLGMALLFGLVTALVWVLNIGSLQTTDRLDKSGVSTQATVITQKRLPPVNQSPNNTDSYQITYQFQAEDGQIYTHDAYVNYDLWQTLPEDTPVQIRYLPTDPHVTQLTQGEDQQSLGWLYYAGLIVFGLLALLGLFIAVWGIRRKSRT